MTGSLERLRQWAQNWAEMPAKNLLLSRLDVYKVVQPLTLPSEVYPPFVSLILQGEKQLRLGSKVVSYRAGQTFVAAIDLPASGHILSASEAAPYLAVRLTFDLAVIRTLIADLPDAAETPAAQGEVTAEASEAQLDAWLRLLQLQARPEDVTIMAPLLEREIVYRLLQGPQGPLLRQMTDTCGYFASIRTAVDWLKIHYATPVCMAALAQRATMSLSVFHRRFKASTGFSPLQYQKHLRLYAARDRLFRQPGNVAAVAAAVGYESLTQFTREYTRLFGCPPARDAKRRASQA